ncbi:hypothetical protein F66182_2265 [Fusarium sp. NRRL 66182]|nr:hypothetical protein F66182_2265 [Fusarium sp. NRRL 66182]
MVKHSKGIIDIAIDTTDDRTRHLTDHIYHILSFAALTLCRIVHTYESKLRKANYGIADLDNLVLRLIMWSKSIVSETSTTLQPETLTADNSLPGTSNMRFSAEELSLSADPVTYPTFTGSEMFDINSGMDSWPEWTRMHSDAEASV